MVLLYDPKSSHSILTSSVCNAVIICQCFSFVNGLSTKDIIVALGVDSRNSFSILIVEATLRTTGNRRCVEGGGSAVSAGSSLRGAAQIAGSLRTLEIGARGGCNVETLVFHFVRIAVTYTDLSSFVAVFAFYALKMFVWVPLLLTD
jgi:hypothetical protein